MSDPFENLSETDQKTAIDIAVAATLLVTRLPELGQEVFDALAKEFASQYGISHNIARYSLQNLGRELFRTGWEMQISKNVSAEVITNFTPGEPVVDTAI